MESIIYIVLTVLLIVILVIIAKYNKLVKLFNKMKKAKSDIEICLNKRFDLMPNLVETVKGYSKHENEIIVHHPFLNYILLIYFVYNFISTFSFLASSNLNNSAFLNPKIAATMLLGTTSIAVL